MGGYGKNKVRLSGEEGRISRGEGVADGVWGCVFGVDEGVSCGGDGGGVSADSEEKGKEEDGGGGEAVGEGESGMCMCWEVTNQQR